MWYVYARNIKSGIDECVNKTFDSAASAIRHIALCYSIDKDSRQLGNYYYFMKWH